MRIEVIAGAAETMRPLEVSTDMLAARLGPGIASARAFWLDRRIGRHHHEGIAEAHGEEALDGFARAVAVDYGERMAPLFVLPGLDGDAAEAGLALLQAVARTGRARSLRLSMVCVDAPGEADRRLRELAGWLGERLDGLTVSTAKPVLVRPEEPDLRPHYLNACANRVLPILRAEAEDQGFAVAPEEMAAAIGARLAAWSDAGRTPRLPLSDAILEALREWRPAEAPEPAAIPRASSG